MISETATSMPVTMPVAIAMGSNLGDSLQILEAALDWLAQIDGICVTTRSSWYLTKPVGPPQPDYWNGAAVLATTLTPLDLLDQLLAVEVRFGRVRQERWGPRTLDLDMLLYGNQMIQTPRLQIPHPHLCDRAFVLVPLAEIAPDWIEPISQVAIAKILKTVDTSGIQSYTPPSESRVPTPESQLPSPESRVPTPNSRVPSPESQLPSPESRVLSPESQLPSPNSRVPTPESRVLTPDS